VEPSWYDALVKEFFEAFRALRQAPLALWLVIFAFSFDIMAYYGMLPLMKAYLGQDIGIPPVWASTWVSVFTGALSLVMLVVGKPVEQKLGIRKGILLALVLTLIGRAIYSSVPFVGRLGMLALSLAIVATGEGIMQPIGYAGIRRYTTEENGAMGYAVLYAVFNLATAFVGPISAKVRTTFDARHAAGTSVLSGFNAVNWICVLITVATLVVFVSFMTPKTEAKIVRRETPTQQGATTPASKSPLADPRFLFFIFALLPVRTLFAHQWLTMPEYVLRSYDQAVADRMEWLVDSANPIIIFLAVPTVTALTKRYHVYTMMLIGTAVSSTAPALLSFGPHTSTLIAYFVVFSLGEALWSARFYEYASELAPEGRVAQYMGVASLPWFLAKATTGLYSGWILEHFCPKSGPKNTEAMWLLYTVIAMMSPVALLLARRWMMAGMQQRPAPAAAAA
jgi:POT family proton-dependent oligopeptide transporter